MTQTIVNISSRVNSANIRRVKRNGRDVIIVPSATLPDDIVMNEVLYPADEIERGYKSLERSPAPLGHPTINGGWVSARDPEGINIGWIGAWNENVRREKGRVFLDKVIDIEVASRTEEGQRVLNAIEKKLPISTSTGLLCIMEAANGEVPYKMIARDMVFDHDAILLDEKPAASTEQGVGMLVNSAGEQEEVNVINSWIDDQADRDIDWAIQEIVRAQEKKAQKPIFDRLKAAVLSAFAGNSEDNPEQQEQEATMDAKDIDALSEKVVSGLTEAITKANEANAAALATAIGNSVKEALKPITDAHEVAANAAKQKDEAEATELRTKLVNAATLTEAEAADLPLAALRTLANKLAPGKAAPINSAFKANSTSPKFDAPEGDD